MWVLGSPVTEWAYTYNGSGEVWSQESDLHLQDSSYKHIWNKQGGLWPHNVYHIDYWKYSSKKVVLLDYDATLDWSSSVAGTNTGFWHEYQRRPDPDSPTHDLVKVHAGFLDGHVEVLEMGQYTQPHRDNNFY